MTGAEIIEIVLQYLDLKPKEFGDKLGYDRPQAIYDIQKGKTKAISTSLANKIISVFPIFNKYWLLTGEGDMLKDIPSREQQDETREPIPAYVLDLLMEKDRMMHEKERELLKQNTALIEQNKVVIDQNKIVIEQNASLIETLKTELQEIKKAVARPGGDAECAAASGFNLVR